MPEINRTTWTCCECCGNEREYGIERCAYNGNRDEHGGPCPVCEVPCPIHGNEPHAPVVGRVAVPECVEGR